MTGFRRRTVSEIADMVCGNESDHFKYRSSTYLSEFFHDCGMPQYVHDGSTRKWWVANVLEDILKQPSESPTLPGRNFQRVIQALMDAADHTEADPERQHALAEVNTALAREGLEAFYAKDRTCYLRSTKTGENGQREETVNRALSEDEMEQWQLVDSFIEAASEDEFTESVILPLLQTLRFQRVSVTGHRDKALEFGKDMWMKYRLPTGHWLYFGLQIKRGRIDSGARSSNDNVAEVHRQVTMMLGHPIFDPDINKKRLVDHAIVIAGGEITKQAKHWLGERLDATQRSQILFMDRNDILRLFVVHNLSIPQDGDDSGYDGMPF